MTKLTERNYHQTRIQVWRDGRFSWVAIVEVVTRRYHSGNTWIYEWGPLGGKTQKIHAPWRWLVVMQADRAIKAEKKRDERIAKREKWYKETREILDRG